MKKLIAIASAITIICTMPVQAAYYHSVAQGAKTNGTANITENKKDTIVKKFKAANSMENIFKKYSEISDTRTSYDTNGEKLSVQSMTIYPSKIEGRLNGVYEDDSKKTWSLAEYIKYQPKTENQRTVNYESDVIYGMYNYQKVQDIVYYFHFFDLDKYTLDITEDDECYTVKASRKIGKTDSILKHYKDLLGIPSKIFDLDTTVTFKADKESLEYTQFDIEVEGYGKIHTDCIYTSAAE